MNSIYNSTPWRNVPYNRFNLGNKRKMSFDMGQIVPSMLREILPGDVISTTPEIMIRAAPLVAPIYDKIEIQVHYYFVAARLLWPDFHKFIYGQEITGEPPWMNSLNQLEDGDLGDYLCYNKSQNAGRHYNPMAIAAYLMIYDHYYRDQNLQTETWEELNNGYNPWVHNYMINPPLKASWKHDYFTSCLPSPQKGDAVSLPLTTDAKQYVQLDTSALNPWSTINMAGNPHSGDITSEATSGDTQAGGQDVTFDPNDTLYVDLNAEAVDIITLRRAMALQYYLELKMLGGQRYEEQNAIVWGVGTSDRRAHIPEYLGGIKGYMTISEVMSNTETLNTSNQTVTPVGQMAGHGIAVLGGKTIKFKAEEHGWLLAVMIARPEADYYQGMPRMHMRFDEFDYANPLFQHIGEQAVYNYEIYCDVATDAEWDGTFGYQTRFAEYKRALNSCHGDFKDTLDFWHVGGRKFATPPLLNSSFLECEPSKRVFAVPTEHTLYAYVINNCSALRKLAKFATPKM